MRSKGCILSTILAAAIASAPVPSAAATFGKVVAIGGHAADIALDETRGQLYIANFTANRIDVMSTADNTIHSSMNVGAQPGALALSPDAKYLVVTNYGNWTGSPSPSSNLITVINLASGARQTFSTGDPPLGVAFYMTAVGVQQALILTTTSFYSLDPLTGYLQFLIPFSALALKLPVPLATFPSQVLETAMTTAADNVHVWGIADAGTGLQPMFRFDGRTGQFWVDTWTTAPPLLGRVSVAADGSFAMIGWSVWAPENCGTGLMVRSRIPGATSNSALGSNATAFNVTGHAVDSASGTIYGQIFDANQPNGPPYTPASPAGTASPATLPALSIMDADNLTVRDRLYIPENLVGRAVLNAAASMMYAISDSGVTVLPVGSLNKYLRLSSSKEDVLLQTNYCTRTPLTQTFTLSDPGGNHTDFAISSAQTGVTVSPVTGTTPATITVTVQPGAIQPTFGTLAVPLTIASNGAVNVPPPVRVLISNPDMDQRGTIVDVPGMLVDIQADSGRNRFYILRQDKNQVLVFNGANYQQVTTLRTQTTPTGMAYSADGKYLIVSATDSQLLTVYDLDSLTPQDPIQLPGGHYGRSVAQSNNAMLALVEDDTCGPTAGSVDRVNFPIRCAFSPPSLGIYTNSCTSNNLKATTVLSPTPYQNSILLASPDGYVMLYDAQADTFTLSRHDLASLSGAYAASDPPAPATGSVPFGSTDQGTYVVGNYIFNPSLVPLGTLDTSVGNTLGFAFTGQAQQGYRVTASNASGAGVIQKLPSLPPSGNVKPVRVTEAPILSTTAQPFTRTVAPLPSAGNIVLLTTSGFTVLSGNYDAAVAVPAIGAVVSAADGTKPVAPGGLISIYGTNLAATNVATSQLPLPTALGQSCMVVNGTLVPLLFVSSTQANAQLPFNVGGNAQMTIHTPGGVSDNFNFAIQQTAPSVFLSGTAGPETGLATIVRADNNELVTPTNPIHFNDTIVIYLTGLGATYPPVDSGSPAPFSPLANALVTPNVTLGGMPLNVFYAGLVPGSVGLYQINATVPFGVPQGLNIPLEITQGGGNSTLNVRVVK